MGAWSHSNCVVHTIIALSCFRGGKREVSQCTAAWCGLASVVWYNEGNIASVKTNKNGRIDPMFGRYDRVWRGAAEQSSSLID